MSLSIDLESEIEIPFKIKESFQWLTKINYDSKDNNFQVQIVLVVFAYAIIHRVCDIWRGYWVQRILWEINAQLAFLNATAIQVRNAHDYLLDFLDELDLYDSAGRLTRYLAEWSPDESEYLFDVILQLHMDMAAGGFWERNEAELTIAWLLDLIDVGY